VPERFRVVPAAYVIMLRPDPDGSDVEQVLLQLREGTGFMDGHWATAAAGHVEARESVFEAAVREAREELDVRIDQGDLIPLCGMHRTGANDRAIDERVDWFFACRHWQGEPQLVETDKAADLGWYPLDALPDPVVPHELLVFEQLCAGTLPAVVAFGFDA
jgi:8-oxo-dGTP diphosphatase